MTQRIKYQDHSARGMTALGEVYAYVAHSGLPKALIDLVYLRVSELNGCAYCIYIHSRDLVRQGTSIDKLMLVQLWRDTQGHFDARERGALAWAEAVTRVAETHVPDSEFDAARAVFSDKELSDLTIAVALMNAYNRVSISLRQIPPPATIAGKTRIGSS